MQTKTDPTRPFAACRRVDDPDQLGDTVVGSVIERRPLATGPYSAQIKRLSLGDVTIDSVRHRMDKGAILAAGGTSEKATTLFVPLSTFRAGTLNGRPVAPGIVYTAESSTPFEIVQLPGLCWATVQVDRHRLEERSLQLGADLQRPPATGVVGRSGRVARSIIDTAARALDLIGAADRSQQVPQGAADTLTDELTILATDLLREPSPPPPTLPKRRRHRLVLDAVDHVARSVPPVRVHELCEALAVPERSLRRAFLEVMGMTPKQYLITDQLWRARRELRRRDPAHSGVCAVATQAGFWELGRFAARYRDAFGETPSATLRRTPRQSP